MRQREKKAASEILLVPSAYLKPQEYQGIALF
jgi:hypothetical protein